MKVFKLKVDLSEKARNKLEKHATVLLVSLTYTSL